jgi:hypothetical protein
MDCVEEFASFLDGIVDHVVCGFGAPVVSLCRRTPAHDSPCHCHVPECATRCFWFICGYCNGPLVVIA